MPIDQGGSPANPDPSTETKQDEIIENQTDGTQKTQISGPLGQQTQAASVAVTPAKDNYDESSRASTIIELQHHKIHESDHYIYTDTVSLGSAATQDYLLTIDNTTLWPHILMNFVSGLDMTIQLFEATDKTGTTLQTTFNNNRNSINSAGMTVHKDQSGGSTDGTLIFQGRVGNSTQGGKIGGIIRTDEEFILKQNNKYIIRITSNAASNNVTTNLIWYENTSLINT